MEITATEQLLSLSVTETAGDGHPLWSSAGDALGVHCVDVLALSFVRLRGEDEWRQRSMA